LEFKRNHLNTQNNTNSINKIQYNLHQILWYDCMLLCALITIFIGSQLRYCEIRNTMKLQVWFDVVILQQQNLCNIITAAPNTSNHKLLKINIKINTIVSDRISRCTYLGKILCMHVVQKKWFYW
jgi:hypothetical protein